MTPASGAGSCGLAGKTLTSGNMRKAFPIIYFLHIFIIL